MSHFAVLVIGENIAEQLQPFHQFECTGIDDEYVVDVDQTEEVRAKVEANGLEEGLAWFGHETRTVASESEADRGGKHKYGYAVVQDGKVIKAVDRTNPNKKWDWWVVGGRYANRLLLKDTGAEADTAVMGEVDLKAMRARAEQNGREWWEAVRAALGDAPEPGNWKMMIERHLGNVDEARKEWQAQPAVVAYAKHAQATNAWPWLEQDDWERAYQPIERTLDYWRRHALSAFAVLKDGKWYERGGMGWFGVVHDEKDDDVWAREFESLVESLSPETRITFVDCHI